MPMLHILTLTVVERVRAFLAPAPGSTHFLDDLDDRTLADIGLSRSEIGSIHAESRGEAQLTRSRIALDVLRC